MERRLIIMKMDKQRRLGMEKLTKQYSLLQEAATCSWLNTTIAAHWIGQFERVECLIIILVI